MVKRPEEWPAPPAEEKAELPPLSQSLQGRMACPHLYRLTSTEEKQDLPSNQYAVRGVEIHDAIETYLKHLVETRQPSDYDYFDKLLESGYGQEALEILDGLKESLIVDPERVLAIEPYLALDEELAPIESDPEAPSHLLQQNPPRGVAFAGIPDFLQAPDTTTIEIWDWKSWFQVIAAETFQSKFYPLLVFKHYPAAELVRFHLKFVRWGVSRSVEYRRDEDLANLEKMAKRERARQHRLHETIEAAAGFKILNMEPIEREFEADLRAMPGAHCIYCPLLAKGCPMAGVNPYTDQTPEERVRFAVWAQAALKQNAGVLREYVKAGGPVTITDDNQIAYAAEFVLTEKRRYPLRPSIDILRAWVSGAGSTKDAELLQKLSISSSELKPLLKAKSRQLLAEALEPMITTTKGTRWHIGPAGKDEEEEDHA